MNTILGLIPVEAFLFCWILLILGLKISGKNSGGLYVNLLLLGVLVAIGLVAFPAPNAQFGDLIHVNSLNRFIRGLLYLGTFFIVIQSSSWLKKHHHAAEFSILLLVVLSGLGLMVSTGNLLIFYLGLEMASIPLAAMASFNLTSKMSGESGLKLILSSAFSSGFLLFGISLIFGLTGTISIAEIPVNLANSTLALIAMVMIFSGFAFKLSAVPFHFWTADVYQGAPMGITAFLAIISKSSIAFVFLTVLFPILSAIQQVWPTVLIALILLTIFTGNIFALRQSSLKRFLAFSSIAQVGFILMGMLVPSEKAAVSVLYFLVVYMFSSICIFGVAQWLEEQTGKDSLSNFKGLYKENPFAAWSVALGLFSLAGIPPTAGFFGKFFLIGSGFQGASVWYVVLVGLNMVISLYYYLKIVKYMFMNEVIEELEKTQMALPLKISLGIGMLAICFLGLSNWIVNHLSNLF